jgi:NAD(P)-dependent dehydrogenase (short-subunit alcohol dehydrogenase family)
MQFFTPTHRDCWRTIGIWFNFHRMNAAPLKDRVIVIVGGTSGLGFSAAKACIDEGAKVVAFGRDANTAEAAQQQLGQTACVFAGNASDPRTVDDAIARALERFNGFHGLYHVAGGSGRRAGDGPLHEITDDGWRQTINHNLTSLFYSNRAAIRQFIKDKTPGSVLNMSSVLGWSPSPRHFATHGYAAAKSAVIGFTKTCASYYADRGIRFNVIAPALVETPMSMRAVGDETIMQFVATKQPLDGGRVGSPADLDAAVVYFLSDQSKFVTGQVLAVDGGWCVTEGQYAP